MARPRPIPDQLKKGPITVTEAAQAGVSRSQLRSSLWRRLGPGRYVWSGLADDGTLDLRSLAAGLPSGAAFSHLTAARLHGLDLPAGRRVDVLAPVEVRCSPRKGVEIRQARLDRRDLARRHGLPVTAPLRTCFDLARSLPLMEAVVATDMALNQRLIGLDELRAYLGGHAAERGARQVRRVVELAEPLSESAMESRLRMLLVLAGLPRPQAQVSLRQGFQFLGRPDLFYAEARLCIEYDGSVHRDRMAADNRRQNRLVGAGYQLLRYTADDVLSHPDRIVSQVERMIRRAPPRSSL